ncbi:MULTISPECIES: NAD-dependent deacylase [unclassified Pseudomonas]|uniref:NAD-dependent deacylase n=1 Tax=unclassified Pseudomonas TaxID=196821 RepID=UPI002B224F2A|nr:MULTISPECIES: NAD-dependent deacylase [unclassified Pseudomonas]MEB0007025.1 NAD-dependent deacylase [Pseudomonas sp. RTB2]MEB0016660.1 NAD-dependent deacylase [Pseudomonas sp. RTB3]MEB0146494.1 NAD-dependent deacylase [Pseudomonas sp. CCC2.2]MEB0268332.1 NAD-dependent deacylase [Pseudomonas sp. 5B4]
MVDRKLLLQTAAALRHARRILIITGAGLSADSGLPTYRGVGGLYNAKTSDGLPIEMALSGPMLRRDPALCWKYIAELGKACLGAQPNAAHYAIAQLQRLKPECWVLTQNVDGYHRAAGSPPERLIEIHGQLAPLFCQSCGAIDPELSEHLQRPLPPLCKHCHGVLRPPVVLFEEMLPERALETLYEEMAKGFDAVLSIGTTASFPYIHEPVLRTRVSGGFTAEINPTPTDHSAAMDVFLGCRALEVMEELVSHI